MSACIACSSRGELTRAGVELPVDLVGARTRRPRFVVEPPLVGAHTLAALPDLGALGVAHRELAAADVELGPLGQRDAPVPQAIERDVVLLHEQESLRALRRSRHPPAGGGLAGTAAAGAFGSAAGATGGSGAGDDGSTVVVVVSGAVLRGCAGSAKSREYERPCSSICCAPGHWLSSGAVNARRAASRARPS